ncbi:MULTISPECIES: DNA-J related domain-containing protein [Gammaproteobacteria]|uniref:DNA-J related domain-containing protein n=1 Tax=Gammaproteobacteria TaxID=1236 RepID=UPI000DD0CA74|nr:MULTISPECIES: DNA-J related domain-containing protein [Gammaproteobacteria]RTE87546.1 molecular chaperone DnaJ [Aliidiomarina sp. B3213]TCZ92669.1 molecular chaperone DnaJ [Lysobacter sp. N42]
MNKEAIQTAVETILLAQVGSLKEFELIQKLQSPPYEILSKKALHGELSLFQTHFLVFHCLYKIRQQWRKEQFLDLNIDALDIRLMPYDAGQSGLVVEDKLEKYYLDWDEWEKTTQADVESLLNQFWSGFIEESRPPSVSKDDALVTLSLEALPSKKSELKDAYRRAIHRTHPDKGGSAEEAQAVQLAYESLLFYV